MATQSKVKIKASDMFVLAILAYLLTLIAPLFGSFANPNNFVATLILRAVCMAAWILGAWGLAHTSKKECGYDIIDKANKPTALQWILTAALTVLFVAYCVIDGWVEITTAFKNLKTVSDYLLFITYYIMNAVQGLVITLIVVFAQKAFEKVCRIGKFIPFGGIVLGLCWAVASLLGSTDLMIPTLENILVPALWSLAYGIVFGVIYLLSGKKALYALPFMAVAFTLM
jgi:hypothetical protein